jgi:hypothetical protein
MPHSDVPRRWAWRAGSGLTAGPEPETRQIPRRGGTVAAVSCGNASALVIGGCGDVSMSITGGCGNTVDDRVTSASSSVGVFV